MPRGWPECSSCLRLPTGKMPIGSASDRGLGMKDKAQYKLALQTVGTVVRAWDPYALLAGGAPTDEFDAEIASVVTQISRIKSSQDAAFAISRVFSSSFERAGFTPEACMDVGEQLFKALSDKGFV